MAFIRNLNILRIIIYKKNFIKAKLKPLNNLLDVRNIVDCTFLCYKKFYIPWDMSLHCKSLITFTWQKCERQAQIHAKRNWCPEFENSISSDLTCKCA